MDTNGHESKQEGTETKLPQKITKFAKILASDSEPEGANTDNADLQSAVLPLPGERVGVRGNCRLDIARSMCSHR